MMTGAEYIESRKYGTDYHQRFQRFLIETQGRDQM